MPTATTTAPPAAPEAPAVDRRKGRRGRLLLVLPLVVVLAVGGFLAKSHFAGSGTPPPDKTKLPGAVVPLQSMTLNLTDGHFLKVGLALQLSEAATPASAADGTSTAPAVDGSKALDAAIAILGAHSYAQLLAPGGRLAAQRALSAEVAKRYDGQVLKVYFTEFVMQ